MSLRVSNDHTAEVGFATSFFQSTLLWMSIYYMIILVCIQTDVDQCDTLTSYSYFPKNLRHATACLVLSSVEILSNGAFVAPAGVVASFPIKRTIRIKYIIMVGWVVVAVGTGIKVSLPSTHWYLPPRRAGFDWSSHQFSTMYGDSSKVTSSDRVVCSS